MVGLEVQSLELWSSVEYINSIPVTSAPISLTFPKSGSQDSHQHVGDSVMERGEVQEWES